MLQNNKVLRMYECTTYVFVLLILANFDFDNSIINLKETQ